MATGVGTAVLVGLSGNLIGTVVVGAVVAGAAVCCTAVAPAIIATVSKVAVPNVQLLCEVTANPAKRLPVILPNVTLDPAIGVHAAPLLDVYAE